MRYNDGDLQLSAGDLAGFLSCKFLTFADLKVAAGELAAPKVWDPLLEVLAERGLQHEQAYLAHLESQGRMLARIGGVGIDANSVAATAEAMASGVDVIVQAAL